MYVLVVITGGAAGDSLAEPGGPGMTYLEGASPVYKNLRIDNKCQKPNVCSHLKLFCVLPVI